MKVSSAKAKGRAAANEVKGLIHLYFPELGEDDVIRAVGGTNGEDIILSEAARKQLPVSIEVKNQEALNIWKALKQCAMNAKELAIPVLFFKRNRTNMYATLDANIFMSIMRELAMRPKNEKGVFVTFETYAEACRKADEDMNRVGFCETFFERVCRHLGISKTEANNET